MSILSETEVGSTLYQPRKNLEDSKDESDAKIFSVRDPETDQHSAPLIQIEMSRQSPQCKETLKELLSRIILVQRLCHMEPVGDTVCGTASAQLLLFSMTQT